MIQQTYQQQVARLVRAMSMPDRQEMIHGDLVEGTPSARVKMFVDGNLEKRLDKIQSQLDFVAEAFDDFDDLIRLYIRNLPLAAYDSGASDGERMLAWLVDNKPLTPLQQDYVACQRARHAVEALARENRLKHVRFQELASLAQRNAAELDTNDTLQVHLNPIRVWGRFVTSELLDEQTVPPTDVMFYAAGYEVATAVLELEGQAMVNELSDYQPCTVGQWAGWSDLADREKLVELCRSLAEIGLLALG